MKNELREDAYYKFCFEHCSKVNDCKLDPALCNYRFMCLLLEDAIKHTKEDTPIDLHWNWQFHKASGFFEPLRFFLEEWWTWLTIELGDNYHLWNLGLAFIYLEDAADYLSVAFSQFNKKGE